MRAALLLLLASATAMANGRPPTTNGVFFAPGDNKTIYVRTTFGLLVSHDDGCTFDWICEQDVGYAGQFDPKYRVAKDGAIFASTFTGLRVSRDAGCNFSTITNGIPAMWIDALDIGSDGAIWAATAESGMPNDIYKSSDNGMTFAPTGMQSPTIWWKSVVAAPSDPDHVYVTGYQVAGTLADGGMMQPAAHFVATTDGGKHWAESPLTGVMYGPTPIVYAMAAQPDEPTHVMMMSTGANPPQGDRLYRTTDGGLTFTEVLATTDPIRDVVYRDATHVIAATIAGGSFESTDGGATFAQMAAPPQLACLGQRGDGQLFGCGANWDPDNKAVARSTDAASWSKVFRFVELNGVIPSCPTGSAEHDMCGPMWPALQQQFGATGTTCGAAPDAPVPDNTVPAKKSGCCDASEPAGLVWALGIFLSLGRSGARGRRRARASS